MVAFGITVWVSYGSDQDLVCGKACVKHVMIKYD